MGPNFSARMLVSIFLDLIYLNYLLIRDAVNVRIDVDICVVFRGTPPCFSCRSDNATDVTDS